MKGIKATCLKCEIKIDMTHAETRPAEKVKELLDHYFSHRYKEKCFIFVTRRENRFCFTCFVPISKINFIITQYQRYYVFGIDFQSKL